nr:hypothetical protein Paeru_mt_15 [Porphyridium aerugineum]
MFANSGGSRTRSSIISHNLLKVYYGTKGAHFFASSWSIDSPDRLSKTIAMELTRLREFSEQNNIDRVNECVKSFLRNPEFWIFCYKNIKSKPKAQFLGGSIFSEQHKPMDCIDLEFFNKLAVTISKGSFKFGFIRRVNIFRSQSRTCSQDIAYLKDKIVQKGLAVILSSLSEHRFYRSSFDFRKGSSCHDALAYIRRKVPSGMWAIEGNINKFFNRFNDKRLVSLIKKKYVTQQVFIDLLYKAFKANIASIKSSFIHKFDTSQGSVISSILLNIYLHELDTFINESKQLAKFRGSKAATLNPQFKVLLSFTPEERLEAKNVKQNQGELKYLKFLHKLRVSKLKIAKKKNISRIIYKGRNRKIVYVRYAAEFIIFVWGTKNDCLEIQKFIKNFLKGTLNLYLFEDKICIKHLIKNKAEFLGFQIWQSPRKLLSKKICVNPYEKKDPVKKHRKFKDVIMQTSSLRITFSMEKVLKRLVDKGLVCYKAGKFFPTSYKSALQYDISNIVFYMKAVFGGLANYYGFAYNWYDAKTLYNYFGRFCTAMTLAHKTKTTVSKIFNKYGVELTIKDDKNKVISLYGILTNSNLKKTVSSLKNKFTSVIDIEQLFLANFTTAKQFFLK